MKLTIKVVYLDDHVKVLALYPQYWDVGKSNKLYIQLQSLNFSVFYKKQFEKIQLIRTYKIFLEKSEISADGVKETPSLKTEENKVLNEKWMIQKFYFVKYFVTSLRSKRRLRTEENKVLTEGWMPQKFYSVKYFVIYLGTCRM